MGHGKHCGGFQGTRPQDYVEGMSIDSLPISDPSLHPPLFPKLEFPKFDGSNPRLWMDHCAMYFEVYVVHPSLKTRFVVLNFVGTAKTWLHTAERKERVADWPTLCKLVMGRFVKGQYPLILKQFEAMTQSGTVLEFIVEFEQAAHNLLLYNPNYAKTYFVIRFLARLKEDIRSAIVLHRPPNVDTASALALLQEAELGRFKMKSVVKEGYKAPLKPTVDKPKQQLVQSESKVKLVALKNFRRKNGLCFKCGNKWSKDHKCPPQVALHVIEELLDALEDVDSKYMELDTEALEETVMAVGDIQGQDPAKRKTMKLCGDIGKHEVLILVDSSSVASFISTQLAHQLGLQTVSCQQTNFIAADGSPMSCTKQVQNMKWSVQRLTFNTTVGILPLKYFDMILGED